MVFLGEKNFDVEDFQVWEVWPIDNADETGTRAKSTKGSTARMKFAWQPGC
jgi:hypothetical protein